VVFGSRDKLRQNEGFAASAENQVRRRMKNYEGRHFETTLPKAGLADGRTIQNRVRCHQFSMEPAAICYACSEVSLERLDNTAGSLLLYGH
jgi:hypothetical protein